MKILVVDDLFNARVLRGCLKGRGFKCEIASNYQEAQDKVGRVDVVIIEILYESGAPSIIQKLREKKEDIIVIVFSFIDLCSARGQKYKPLLDSGMIRKWVEKSMTVAEFVDILKEEIG